MIPSAATALTFCGRHFSVEELELMRQIASEFAALGVTEISRTFANCWSGNGPTDA